jgi:hypothetical protein
MLYGRSLKEAVPRPQIVNRLFGAIGAKNSLTMTVISPMNVKKPTGTAQDAHYLSST